MQLDGNDGELWERGIPQASQTVKPDLLRKGKSQKLFVYLAGAALAFAGIFMLSVSGNASAAPVKPTWRSISAAFNQAHVILQQNRSLAISSTLPLSCYSSANMHLLATLPIGTSILVKCPSDCLNEKNAKVKELQQIGAAVWGTDLYTDHSFICHASRHRTGKDEGMFVLTIKDATVRFSLFSIAKQYGITHSSIA
jgi:hypothetical protein